MSTLQSEAPEWHPKEYNGEEEKDDKTSRPFNDSSWKMLKRGVIKYSNKNYVNDEKNEDIHENCYDILSDYSNSEDKREDSLGDNAEEILYDTQDEFKTIKCLK